MSPFVWDVGQKRLLAFLQCQCKFRVSQTEYICTSIMYNSSSLICLSMHAVHISSRQVLLNVKGCLGPLRATHSDFGRNPTLTQFSENLKTGVFNLIADIDQLLMDSTKRMIPHQPNEKFLLWHFTSFFQSRDCIWSEGHLNINKTFDVKLPPHPVCHP